MLLVGGLPARSPETLRYPISELVNPCPERFVTHNDASRREQIFDVPKAERKAVVCLNRVGKDRMWETAALKAGSGKQADQRHGLPPTKILVNNLMML